MRDGNYVGKGVTALYLASCFDHCEMYDMILSKMQPDIAGDEQRKVAVTKFVNAAGRGDVHDVQDLLSSDPTLARAKVSW